MKMVKELDHTGNQSNNEHCITDEIEDKNTILYFSFVDPHGNTVVVKYRAGKNGFEILNPDEVLPKAPQAY